MKVAYKSVATPFRHPFTISKGTKTHQPALLVELEYFGFKGYGEAPAITYYNITVEQMIADLESKKQLVEKFSFSDPERYWHYLHHLFPKNPFLVCALDMAAWDLFGKMKKLPLYQYWKLDPANAPVTDFTIGLDTPEMMLQKMLEQPWPIYKIKMAAPEDIRTLQLLRKHTNASFRIDANAAWELSTALELIPRLKELNVELVEQPLAKDDWDGMKILYEKSVLPIFADESCVSEQDVNRCIGYFHGINIKLTKCSGITPARRMIADARTKGLKVMLGCMNEAVVGTAALAHLAPMADYMDMDGPLLLLNENKHMEVFSQTGAYQYNDLPGLGVHRTAFTP
ncbi:MAG: dipeptide epimerase [Sphingobacteriales bacterium]|jgi:L-Ala-D/L-Glu epimerase|nr:dipeptide epimerase [Sphingobacteriales bacterium]